MLTFDQTLKGFPNSNIAIGAELAKALNNAQSKMGAAIKGSKNPYFKSKYADLNSVIEACKEQLNSEGITVLQPIISDTSGDYVETILLHTSGQQISSRMKLKVAKDNDMQAYGSAISYARRYGLQSMIWLPSSEDDDAESAMRRGVSDSIPNSAASKKEEAPVEQKVVNTEEKKEEAKSSSFFKPNGKKVEWK